MTTKTNLFALPIFLIAFSLFTFSITHAQEKQKKEIIVDKPNKANRTQKTTIPNAPQATGDKVIIKDEQGNSLIEINDEGTYGTITLPSTSSNPGVVTNKLYNVNGTLNFNGTALGSGGASKIDDLSDAKHDFYTLFLGEGAGINNPGSNFNTAVGYHALKSTTSGWNTAVGSFTLTSNTTGIENTGMGVRTLQSNTTGNANTAFGYEALGGNKGYSNTAIGKKALYSNTIGYFNTAIGDSALAGNSTGKRNTANGYSALASNNEGFNNTANGAYSLYSNNNGWYNTATGYEALYSNEEGNNNVAIGFQAGYIQTGHNNISIGFKAGWAETGSDKLYIENSTSSTPLIGGDFAADEIYLNAQVRIGTGSAIPEGELHIDAQSATRPAIFIENATASEGDITWDSNEHLQIGTWNQSTNTFSEKMRIENGGDVGIGNTNPTHLLDVGTNGAYCDGGAWVNGSSRMYKNNIEALTLQEAEKAFKALEPVKFTYKATPAEKHVGFIAEDVPKLVATKDRKGLTALDIVAVLTKVVQKQQQVIDKLDKENSKINKRLGVLEQKLDRERFTSVIK